GVVAEELRTTEEGVRRGYGGVQATQLQLVQREKMASVGQLVAGVAHELNNPIGFISSNVATLADFVQRLRGMLETYQAAPLAETDHARVEARRRELKVDSALKYLDPLISGIRAGAAHSGKIVGARRPVAG